MRELLHRFISINFHQHIRLIGLLSIIVFLATLLSEIVGIAEVCPYCRVIRVCVGLVGFVMVLPLYPIFSKLFALVFGFMGAYVAAANIFMNIARAHYFSSFTFLSSCAMIIIAAQMMIILSYDFENDARA